MLFRSTLESCGADAELAYTLHDLGQARQEAGEYEQARVIERRAATVAKRCGIDLTRIAEPATVASALSDAQLRVATLAAQGLTNREIAHQLYVTISTVEQHLTQVYRKLKVNRRADLSSELHALFVTPTPAAGRS